MLFNSVKSSGTLIFPKLQAFYSSNDTMAAYNYFNNLIFTGKGKKQENLENEEEIDTL